MRPTLFEVSDSNAYARSFQTTDSAIKFEFDSLKTTRILIRSRRLRTAQGYKLKLLIYHKLNYAKTCGSSGLATTSIMAIN